ncbi:MAG TPA: L-threonylcarbamoyladenylate synthase [Burkholderiales bacterium]|jgi:L-threonylcarbamoyladenylate synthase|nr:L-threonylcarbamoyladenylate synthase [Burkholderiales bacterium]
MLLISDSDIDNAVAILRSGGLVAFPTETVYGLGADAANPSAVRKIYETKGRPSDHPVIVHVADAVQVANWARDIPDAAHRLARRFWPGPLTLVLQRARGVGDFVTGGQDTVAVRVPSHPVAQQLLRRFGGGVAAPSANRFGRVSATTAAHVRQEFGAAVECVLDGGAADVGIESTIVDLSGGKPRLLRPGWITAAAIEEALEERVIAAGAGAPRAPGMLAAHYAPLTPLALAERDLLLELAASLGRQGRKVAVLALSSARPLDPVIWLVAPADPAGYAHTLYANLREADEAGCDALVVERPPQTPEWAAVNDRLSRAAAGTAAQDEI